MTGSLLLDALRRPGPLVSVELRPPRSGLEPAAGMAHWIDLHHALGRLTRDGTFVYLTDNAVGAEEEENLAHVGANLGAEADRRRIVPILTCKHALEYCMMFASRASSQGYDSLTVLGGDPSAGPPRCLPRSRDLRERIRGRVPGLALGGWVNPLKDPDEQVGHLTAHGAHADFALSQIVSHHAIPEVVRFLEVLDATGTAIPVAFGVFFYRSANRDTLGRLGEFFPVPREGVTAEFQQGDSAVDICARSIRELRRAGADKVYVSNLGNRDAGRRLRHVLERV